MSLPGGGGSTDSEPVGHWHHQKVMGSEWLASSNRRCLGAPLFCHVVRADKDEGERFAITEGQ